MGCYNYNYDYDYHWNYDYDYLCNYNYDYDYKYGYDYNCNYKYITLLKKSAFYLLQFSPCLRRKLHLNRSCRATI